MQGAGAGIGSGTSDVRSRNTDINILTHLFLHRNRVDHTVYTDGFPRPSCTILAIILANTVLVWRVCCRLGTMLTIILAKTVLVWRVCGRLGTMLTIILAKTVLVWRVCGRLGTAWGAG